MTTPAERYAASRQRQQDLAGGLREFTDSLSYELDPFQVEACRALQRGAGVLVAAPTGSGKTVVGEYAAFLALKVGARAFYTTPIKALSNQKFREFQEAFGSRHVGLLTGDNSINAHAPLVVMTTEVLRNMIYADPEGLDGLSVVVMDEVHYLADRTRGAVWEEVIIHLPPHVRIVALSATVSNAEEFGAWLNKTRGDVEVVVEEHRPVPLDQHIFVDHHLHPLFTTKGTVNPEVVATVRRLTRGQPRGRMGFRPSRIEVVDTLSDRQLLPGIFFIFSRAGCEAALSQCRGANVRLTTSDERQEIANIVDSMCESLPDEDLAVLQWHEWRESLMSGLAAHHAGLVPLFKEVVERLFQVGLIKVVFATETLALGINMPARSVVIERLTKWDGHAHVSVSAGEYTQLTGRAGRRGLDEYGDAVVVWEPALDLGHLAGLASTRTYPLKSSFRPTYNMAVNLIMRYGARQAGALLERSFAQFQVDAHLSHLSTRSAQLQAEAHEQTEFIVCHLGDFDEYFSFREQLTVTERAATGRKMQTQRAGVDATLRALRKGDIIMVNRGRRSGPAVVLESSGSQPDDAARPLVLSQDKVVRRVSWTDFEGPVPVVGSLKIPAAFSVKSSNARKRVSDMLRSHMAGVELPRREPKTFGSVDDEIASLRARLRAHPCHGCHDREVHARAAAARARALRESHALSARVDGRTGSLGQQFERVCAVMSELGYLSAEQEPQVTASGQTLARIYADLDLLTAQSLHEGVFDGLSPVDMVGVAAFLVYEARTDEARVDVPLSSDALRTALPKVYRVWSRIVDVESDFAMNSQRPLDAGLVRPALAWARMQPLAAVLRMADLSPGDFVRWMKQVMDWLAHVEAAAPDHGGVSRAACEAASLVNRGIVALAPSG